MSIFHQKTWVDLFFENANSAHQELSQLHFVCGWKDTICGPQNYTGWAIISQWDAEISINAFLTDQLLFRVKILLMRKETNTCYFGDSHSRNKTYNQPTSITIINAWTVCIQEFPNK